MSALAVQTIAVFNQPAYGGLRSNGTENLHKECCRRLNPTRAMRGSERSAAARG